MARQISLGYRLDTHRHARYTLPDMTRQDRFLASLALYAVDLSGLTRAEVGRIDSTGEPLYRYEIPAVWFRRRQGVDTSNVGFLWDISRRRHEEGDETAARSFLSETLTDGRYGPTCCCRWDGVRIWADPALALEQVQVYATFLRRMLDAYPQIPEYYDGWWRF